MKTNPWKVRLAVSAATAIAALRVLTAGEPALLWRIGQADNANAEFALAPKNHDQFKEDGFFVVGQSDARRDWPYVHPGPGDGWAGGRRHTFTVLFALRAAPVSGQCRLVLDLLDAHASAPPRLRVEVNGRAFEQSVPGGAGDASIFGDPARGREIVREFGFPSDLLRAGENEIAITTLSGSWVLYDAVTLEAPAGTALATVAAGTRLVGVQVPPVWLREGDRAVQPVNVTLRHVGPDADVEVRLGDAAAKALRLTKGSQTIELRAPAAEQTRRLDLTVRVGDRLAASTNLTLAPPRLREMWILPHSHVDIGYTHRQEEVVKVQISNLELAMELARASATNAPGLRYKWNPEAVWALDHFLQRATPEKRQAFISAVQKGEVGVDGLFGNMLTGLCRPEELAQCLAFGARLSNLTGVPVESAAICDVPGWTWGLVPMMAQAGVKYFAIGPNFGDRVGTIHLWDNKPFYWKSPSGRERLLCWVVDNYHFFGRLEDHVLAQLEKLGRTGFPYDTSFLFWVGLWPNGGVDNAPPDETTVEKVVAWNAKYAAPRVVIGLVGDYFREFERRHGASLPEFSGDLTPYWEDGAGSTSRETALNRASADRLSQAEALFAMRRAAASPGAQFDAAWKNVLLYSEHTWGAWNSISDPDQPFVRDQWQVKQAFALDADRQSRELLAAALPDSKSATAALDVFNTTQWERTDLAVVPHGLVGESVLDDRGRPVPTQRLASGELVFMAPAVPPFGARRFRLVAAPSLVKGQARADDHGLRTDRLTVVVDERSGAVRSLRLGGLKHEFVDAAAPVALNDFRYVLGTDAQGAKPNGPVTISVLDAGPLVASLRIESAAPGCNRLVREVRLVDGLDRVEFINHVDRQAVRQKDGVHFGFGFNVPQGAIHMETPWAVVRPNLDQLPGSCRNWFTVQRWVDVSNPDCGITWAPLDAPLMQIGGITANLLGAVPFNEWMTNALDSQTLYSWAQNNHWHTNYKIDQPGLTTFRFVVQPHRRGYSAAEAARFGLETTRPLLVAAVDPVTPVPASLLSISPPSVLVETVKASTDGRAIIVRLFGVSSANESARLAWRGIRPAKVSLTDLTERPGRSVTGRVDVPAHGVVSLRADLP